MLVVTRCTCQIGCRNQYGFPSHCGGASTAKPKGHVSPNCRSVLASHHRYVCNTWLFYTCKIVIWYLVIFIPLSGSLQLRPFVRNNSLTIPISFVFFPGLSLQPSIPHFAFLLICYYYFLAIEQYIYFFGLFIVQKLNVRNIEN